MKTASDRTSPEQVPGKLELEMTRVIDAPRQLVWEAHTRAEHLARWWGPAKYTLEVVEMDFRPGGRWRFHQHGPDGAMHPFTGVYKEIVEAERLVLTFTYDVEGARDQELLDVTTFEDLDGKTRLTTRMVFPSREAMEAMVSSGMEDGWTESVDRLEQLLASLS